MNIYKIITHELKVDEQQFGFKVCAVMCFCDQFE
jgi:hypothetical protein